MYLMKIHINFWVKKIRSVFNENTDQFCTQKIKSKKLNLKNIDQFLS